MCRSASCFAVTVLVFALACASSTDTSSVAVDLKIVQLPDAGFAVEDKGAFSVAFQMTVRNRSTETITLRQVEMKTVRDSSYTLRNTPAVLNEKIEAGQEAVVVFTMWKYLGERRSTVRGTIWVSGTAYFDTTKGSYKKEFTQSFREP